MPRLLGPPQFTQPPQNFKKFMDNLEFRFEGGFSVAMAISNPNAGLPTFYFGNGLVLPSRSVIPIVIVGVCQYIDAKQ